MSTPENPDRPSAADPYIFCGLAWHCWITAAGAYEWRAVNGRLVVGREYNPGHDGSTRRTFWVCADDVVVSEGHPDIMDAMRAAMEAARSDRRAA